MCTDWCHWWCPTRAPGGCAGSDLPLVLICTEVLHRTQITLFWSMRWLCESPFVKSNQWAEINYWLIERLIDWLARHCRYHMLGMKKVKVKKEEEENSERQGDQYYELGRCYLCENWVASLCWRWPKMSTWQFWPKKSTWQFWPKCLHDNFELIWVTILTWWYQIVCWATMNQKHKC